jgi:hypothetical protein
MYEQRHHLEAALVIFLVALNAARLQEDNRPDYRGHQKNDYYYGYESRHVDYLSFMSLP